MTTLVMDTLESTLSQSLSFKLNRRVQVGSLVPYLYVHNFTGSVSLSLTGASGTLFSKTFSLADIKTSLGTTDNYHHVFYSVIPTNPTQLEKGEYTLTLAAGSGYSSTGISFIGWIKQHENIQNEMDYIPLSDIQNSYAVRFKEYKEGINV